MFSSGLRAEQIGRRHLSDVQLSHLYKCWAAELTAIGRSLPHWQSALALSPGQTMMERRPNSGVLMRPQCPPLADLALNILDNDNTSHQKEQHASSLTEATTLPL